jgi:hypothetical protein
MARKRDDGAGPPAWGEQVRMRREAALLVDADDAAVEERAQSLQCEASRLRAFVAEARRRMRSK